MLKLVASVVQNIIVNIAILSQQAPILALGCTWQNVTETGTEKTIPRGIQVRDKKEVKVFPFQSGGPCDQLNRVRKLNR